MFHPTSRMHGVAVTTRRIGWIYIVQGLALAALAGVEVAGRQRAAGLAGLSTMVLAGGAVRLATGWRLDRGDLWAYGVAVPLVGALFAGECVLVITNVALFRAVPYLGLRAGWLLMLLPGVGFANAVYALSDVRDAYRGRRRESLYARRGFEPTAVTSVPVAVAASAGPSTRAEPTFYLTRRMDRSAAVLRIAGALGVTIGIVVAVMAATRPIRPPGEQSSRTAAVVTAAGLVGVGTACLVVAWQMRWRQLWAYGAAAALSVAAAVGLTAPATIALGRLGCCVVFACIPLVYFAYACCAALPDVRDAYRSRSRDRPYDRPASAAV